MNDQNNSWCQKSWQINTTVYFCMLTSCKKIQCGAHNYIFTKVLIVHVNIEIKKIDTPNKGWLMNNNAVTCRNRWNIEISTKKCRNFLQSQIEYLRFDSSMKQPDEQGALITLDWGQACQMAPSYMYVLERQLWHQTKCCGAHYSNSLITWSLTLHYSWVSSTAHFLSRLVKLQLES